MSQEINELYESKIKELRIIDDKFSKIFFRNKECVKAVVDIVTDRDITIEKHETQANMETIVNRSLVFDVLVLSKDVNIDLEFDKQIQRVNASRIRYHTSVLDVSISKPQDILTKRNNLIVIFICEFDLYHLGLPLYHVERRVRESNELFDDHIEIIIVNATYKGNDKIGQLIHDLTSNNYQDMHNEALKINMRYYKEEEGGKEVMSEIWDEIRQYGRQEGKIEGKIEGQIENTIDNLKSLMQKLNINIEDAMDLLNIEGEFRNKIQSMIE